MSQIALGVKSFGLSVVGLLLLAGCGGGDDGAFKGPFGQVTGKVTFEGKPIPEGSQVVFQAVTAGYLATGTVNASGEYTLQYNGSADIPGVLYQVTFMQATKPTGTADDPAATPKLDPVTSAKVEVSKAAPPFPAKYSSPTKDAVFTVKEGKNTADFVLTK